MAPILAVLLTLLPARAAQWPDWSLPAPLPRPGQQDLVYPAWFAGRWQVSDDEGHRYSVRFARGGDRAERRQGRQDGVVGDRAFNAASVGRAFLGADLLAVQNDPANPNRQIARLAQGQQLESTVVGRRSETDSATGRETDRDTATAVFWADELALQVLHAPGGEPRVTRVETLSRYQREADGSISAEQWQARYPSPALGLAARAQGTGHYRFRLDPEPPQSGPAS